ncbi:MAG: putative metal-binding motif-containing protein [Deltaproteobacteria bacterium]|nr:putative metal-binding motif-containing protein [Deltaproteobacteria bacterium]
MKRKWIALLAVVVLSTGCKGTLKATGDAGPDADPDVGEEDVAADVPVDAEPDAAPDGVEDPVEDGTTDPVEDAPEDTPADPVVDTIGGPCTTDEDCDMGVFCDGPEYCHPSGVCRRAPPPTCDDGDDCTTDSCDVTTDACVHDLIDGDGDLHAPESCGGDDCDDTESTIYTGAPETCGDGIDQDCDGADNVIGECMCAPSLTAPGAYSGATTGGVVAHTIGSCAASSGAPDVYHELVLGSDTDVLIDLSAGGWDAIAYVRSGTCDGSEIECNEDWSPSMILSLTAGTYYVIVDGREGGETGDYTLTLETCTYGTAVTGNGICTDAYAITADGLYSGDNTGLGDDAVPTTCATDSAGRGGHDVWFTFTLTGSTAVHLDTVCSEFDTVLYILEGACDGTEVACDDDSDIGYASSIDVTLDAGTYYVVLDGYYGASDGQYVLNITGL